MSRYTSVKLEFKDGEVLKAALKELGYGEIEVYADPQDLIGYQGDARTEKAHIIIRRKHIGAVSNDVGFLKNSRGTYDMVVSEYDQHNPRLTKQLPQVYGVLAVKKQMKIRGYSINSQKTDAKGRVKLKIVIP